MTKVVRFDRYKNIFHMSEGKIYFLWQNSCKCEHLEGIEIRIYCSSAGGVIRLLITEDVIIMRLMTFRFNCFDLGAFIIFYWRWLIYRISVGAEKCFYLLVIVFLFFISSFFLYVALFLLLFRFCARNASNSSHCKHTTETNK